MFKYYIREEMVGIIEKNDNLCKNYDSPKEIISKTTYIDDYIKIYTTYSKIISESFYNNNLFNVSFKEVLEKIQSDNNKFNNSYIIPFYLDKYLKRSSSNNSTESHQVIDYILNIFPTLPEKDIFIDIHRNLVKYIN
jgi:hypothetical protein